MDYLQLLSLVFLVLFLLVATVDGLYFHLWKYKLFLHAESRYEHKLHTIRAFLFIPIVFLLFYADFGGLALWAGIFFLAADLVVEMLDVLCERDSRATIGGLTSAEYAAHVLATSFRAAAIVLALAGKSIASWSFTAPLFTASYGSAVQMIVLNVIIGNFLTGALHVLLMNEKFRQMALFSCCNLNRSR